MELSLFLKQQAWIFKAKVRTYKNWWSTTLIPYDASYVKKVIIKPENTTITLDTVDGPLVFNYLQEDNQENNVHAFLFILTEIFIWKIYNADIKGKPVVDIGAGIGDSAIYFATQGASKVYAYEPGDGRFKLAEQNISQNNMQGKIELFHHPYDFKVPLKNALLKIDCDGCEYEVFDKLDFGQFDEIVMEYHKGPKQITDKLTANGFKILQMTPANKLSGYLHAKK
jgi:hypothetical protein